MVLCHKRQDRSGSLAVIALQEEVARLAQEVQQAEEAPKRRRMCLELFGNRCSRFVSFSLWLELNLDIYLFDLIYIYIYYWPQQWKQCQRGAPFQIATQKRCGTVESMFGNLGGRVGADNARVGALHQNLFSAGLRPVRSIQQSLDVRPADRLAQAGGALE